MLGNRGGDQPRRLPSWTGTGNIEVNPHARERAGVLGATFVVLLCLALDAISLFATILLTQLDNRIVCGRLCFDNPRAHIHDAVVTLWAFGIATIGSALVSLVVRRLRLPVLLVQGVVAAFVLIHTVPELRAAEHRQDLLERCQYGYASPCPGLTNLGPP